MRPFSPRLWFSNAFILLFSNLTASQHGHKHKCGCKFISQQPRFKFSMRMRSNIRLYPPAPIQVRYLSIIDKCVMVGAFLPNRIQYRPPPHFLFSFCEPSSFCPLQNHLCTLSALVSANSTATIFRRLAKLLK